MTDNESVVHKQTAKYTKILGLLCAMVLICLRNDIFFRARHIPGVRNVLADSLSRLQVDKFHKLSRGMDPTPIPLPTHLLPENWVIDISPIIGSEFECLFFKYLSSSMADSAAI